MPHVTENTQSLTFSDFVALHRQQLLHSAVPERYWSTLFLKLKDEVYDAGSVFQIVQIQYENDGEGETECYDYKVRVIHEEGIELHDPNHIYLIDHAWTYRIPDARKQLTEAPGLLERMENLMEVSTDSDDKDEKVEAVLKEMWRYNQTYSIGNFTKGSEDSLPVWYIMDEFGSRISHSDEPSFKTVPFYYSPSQLAYTIMWPLRDLDQGDDVTRDYVENVRDPNKRAARLLPWKPVVMTYLPSENEEFGDEYFLEFKGEETLPNPDAACPQLPKDRSIKVYFDFEVFSKHLTDPRFEVVTSTAEADIWWLYKSFKDFKGLSEEAPNTFINQFPNESLVTVKDLLAITSRRVKSGETRGDNSNKRPAWLPLNYNLQVELPKFVSCFQKRDVEGLDNHWICKPWNLARSMDIHITDDINYIVRLAETGPKVACKYVDQPVLFNREEVGPVKFDIRYMILLASSSPLKLYVYKVFWLRFANKPFSMDHFDEYEKHFTVMNYNPNVTLKQVHYDEFIPMFEAQYPDYHWANLEVDIFKMIRELFEAAVSEPYPKGIPASPQSRAIYAIDFLLKWDTNSKGERVMQPVICEVNFGPDCDRACKYHPNFINDILSALFLDDITDRPVILLT